jgi:hypothetical protein
MIFLCYFLTSEASKKVPIVQYIRVGGGSYRKFQQKPICYCYFIYYLLIYAQKNQGEQAGYESGGNETRVFIVF